MDLMNLITGGAQPQPSFDERYGAPPAQPDIENLLRAIAMQRMQGAEAQQMPEPAPFAPPMPAPYQETGWGSLPSHSAYNRKVREGFDALEPPAPDAPLSDGPQVFGLRARSPNDIPLLRPDPRETGDINVTSQRVIRAPDAAPEFPIGAPMQAQPSMQDMLPTARDRTLKNALSGFAAGVAKMPGNTRGSALGRGFGGAVAGADAAERVDFDESVKALEQVRRAAALGDEGAYKSALADYYRAYAAKMRAEIGPDGQRVAGAAKSSAQERMRDWVIDQYKAENGGKKPTLEQLNILLKDPNAQRRFQQQLELADIREAGANARSAARTDSQNFRRDAPSVTDRFQQNRGMVTGKKGEQAAPAEKPAEIDMKGNGSQANPYKPTSDAEYNDMPVGTYYQHPSDPPGKLRIKGKGPA